MPVLIAPGFLNSGGRRCSLVMRKQVLMPIRRLFLPGDWLYYVNHSYGDIEHSGVFVDWTDYARSEGLVLSYAGEQRNEPGRYKVYDLSHVYRITRAQ